MGCRPKQFGYNGIKGGMSGVSFVVGWVYAHTPNADRLIKGPYDPDSKKGWDEARSRNWRRSTRMSC